MSFCQFGGCGGLQWRHDGIRKQPYTQAVLTFLRTDVPQNWLSLCDYVSDNFRIIQPQDFRVVN